jgi:uncharacterized membrane protein YheB (UPF0754 family)
MFIYLLYDKPWTIAAGGLIVGIITNAIAIKLIFEPVRVLQTTYKVAVPQHVHTQKYNA